MNAGVVAPNTGGMSVGPSLRALPFFLVPQRLRHLVPQARGKDRDACWKMGEGAFESGQVADGLVLRLDSPNHGLIEPVRDLKFSDFQAAIAATREQWVIDEQ